MGSHRGQQTERDRATTQCHSVLLVRNTDQFRPGRMAYYCKGEFLHCELANWCEKNEGCHRCRNDEADDCATTNLRGIATCSCGV